MEVQLLPDEIREIFPYDYLRKGQAEIILKINQAVKAKKHIIIEAANGIGKTISVLSAVLPIALEYNLKIVYLSRTHSQLERVLDELDAIRRKTGLSIPSVGVRSRRDMCLHRMVRDNPLTAKEAIDVCHLLKRKKRCSYFENLKNADVYYRVLKLVGEKPIKPRELIKIGRLYQICPYELNKELVSQATVISAPYIYLLDSTIRETFFEALGSSMGNIIFVFDEAHNLPNLAVEALSSTLSTISIKRAINESIKYGAKKAENALKTLESYLEKNAIESEGEILLNKSDLLAYISPAEKNISVLKNLGEKIKEMKLEEGKTPISYIYSVSRFLERWKDADEEKSVFILSMFRLRKDLIPQLELVGLDARDVIRPLLSALSTISLSGTIHKSYIDVVGLSEQNYEYYSALEPFDSNQFLITVTTDVTTRLVDRSLDTYKRIISYLQELIKYTPHNVGIFCPSYDVLQDLVNAGIKEIIKDSGKTVFVENAQFSSIENDALLEQFKKAAYSNGGVLLGVMGGRNSEGADFPGKEMETVVVLGIPLARPIARVEAKIKYFNKIFGEKGKKYSYIVPAIYKAAQTAGRVVRTPEDRGVIVFLDKRYLWNYYRDILPNWLKRNIKTISSPMQLSRLISNFYRNNSKQTYF